MESPFSFKITKSEKLLIYRDHKLIMTLKGKKSSGFINEVNRLSEDDIQMKLAKLTGHYKHGNEKSNVSE